MQQLAELTDHKAAIVLCGEPVLLSFCTVRLFSTHQAGGAITGQHVRTQRERKLNTSRGSGELPNLASSPVQA